MTRSLTLLDAEVGSAMAKSVEGNKDGESGFHTFQPHRRWQAVDNRFKRFRAFGVHELFTVALPVGVCVAPDLLLIERNTRKLTNVKHGPFCLFV